LLVVATNILFSFAVDNDWSNRARVLAERHPHWHTEAHALVETTNALVRYARNRLMSDTEALHALKIVEAAVAGRVHRVAHDAAYSAARSFNVSAYDARFLVVARKLGRRLITEDAKLRRAAPELTQSLDEALAAT
jgi:predicted nucleic acid-binding protein